MARPVAATASVAACEQGQHRGGGTDDRAEDPRATHEERAEQGTTAGQRELVGRQREDRLVDERRQPIRANLWYELRSSSGAVLRRRVFGLFAMSTTQSSKT